MLLLLRHRPDLGVGVKLRHAVTSDVINGICLKAPRAAISVSAAVSAPSSSMQSVVQIARQGGIDQMVYTTAPKPQPAGDEVLVRNSFAGVNFIDTYHRSGLYPVPLPFTLGVEGSGVVEALGPQACSAVKVGDKVAYFDRVGSYAEYSKLPSSRVIKVPPGVPLDLAAAAMVQGMTALALVTRSYAVKEGNFVLVHAAAGGTGQLLTQLCKHFGAHVIGTTSTEEKAAIAKAAGARDVVLYTQQDVVAEVARITGGRGVHVVYDGVGKDTWEASLKSCGPGATLVSFGNASGKVPPVDILTLSTNNIRLMRPTLFEYCKGPALQEIGSEMFGLLQSGVLRPCIQKVFPLQEAAQAHTLIEGRKTIGKLLLSMDGA